MTETPASQPIPGDQFLPFDVDPEPAEAPAPAAYVAPDLSWPPLPTDYTDINDPRYVTVVHAVGARALEPAAAALRDGADMGDVLRATALAILARGDIVDLAPGLFLALGDTAVAAIAHDSGIPIESVGAVITLGVRSHSPDVLPNREATIARDLIVARARLDQTAWAQAWYAMCDTEDGTFVTNVLCHMMTWPLALASGHKLVKATRLPRISLDDVRAPSPDVPLL